ncbi:MAG: MoaD/ThiS family protein [Candidatus Micrarchaeia archaeon]
MIVKIFGKERKKINFSGKVIDLLKKFGINKEIVVVFRNGKIVTEMDELKNKDKVEIVRVVFGG